MEKPANASFRYSSGPAVVTVGPSFSSVPVRRVIDAGVGPIDSSALLGAAPRCRAVWVRNCDMSVVFVFHVEHIDLGLNRAGY